MNSDIKRIGTGARMSEAVCYNGIVWLAGQVGNPGESVADQTRTCDQSFASDTSITT